MFNHTFLICFLSGMLGASVVDVVCTKKDNKRISSAAFAAASLFALLAVIVHTIWGPR